MQLCECGEQRRLRFVRHLCIEPIDLLPERIEPIDRARYQAGPHHGQRLSAGFFSKAVHERHAGTVDERVGVHGRQDLAPQRVPWHGRAATRQQRMRKVSRQAIGNEGLIGQPAGQQRVVQPHLAVGHQHRAFGRGEATAGSPAGVDFLIGRQEFDEPVQAPGALQIAHQPRFRIEPLRRARTRE